MKIFPIKDEELCFEFNFVKISSKSKVVTVIKKSLLHPLRYRKQQNKNESSSQIGLLSGAFTLKPRAIRWPTLIPFIAERTNRIWRPCDSTFVYAHSFCDAISANAFVARGWDFGVFQQLI
ncbi:hypothetical protein CDAR_124281 [Caerostris darwini]|uniref:Uncharacterized protein n=1 Tax=Caerostris darwini TaxID=1538125 RepID=A0AAV4RA85_9ARAC|nr:hypothetical protein CDAR_124281 [Caerostris darwini]